MTTPAVRGRGAVALGLGLLLLGAMFGLPSLFPPGAALIALPLLAAGWVGISSRRLHLGRSVPAGPLLEHELGKLRLELHGRRTPPPGGLLSDPLLPEAVRFGPRLVSIDRDVGFDRRGRRTLGRAVAVVRDPLGLAERSIGSADAGELLVLPRPEELRFAGGGSGARSLGIGTRGGGGSGPDSWAAEFEIDGLRSYRDGSPASRIHWPTVARTGELVERRITAGADAARLVVVDPVGPAGDEQLDAAMRAAASLCLELANAGCAVLIPPSPRMSELDATLRSWPELHARLALLGPDDGAPAASRIGRAGLAVWVSADPGPRPERELRRLNASRRILVRPDPTGDAGALFTVAGCTGRPVGASHRRRAGSVAR